MRTRPYPVARRGRGLALVAAGALALTTAAVPTLTAGAAPPADAGSCPASYPVSELVDDQPVTGLTVHRGTQPAPFTGTVLGVLRDGIAPGLDMIMVELTSEAIDDVGGIWAGMSGSPVYAEDGRLIGAVSYGLALGPSPVAGVTPAEDMRALLSGGAAPAVAEPPEEVPIPTAMRREMVASGDATSTEAQSGLHPLSIPVGVSGLTNKRVKQLNRMLDLDDVHLYRAPSGVSADGTSPATSAADAIVPGGNLAASMSYGDLSTVGTGTTTLVCGAEAVGFGHPFGWTGRTTLTMHGADAVYVQKDPTLFPFKVSNAGAPLGTIDQDRLAGIKGVLDALPDTATVTTDVTNRTTGRSRTGVTKVSLPEFTPDAAAFGLLANQDRMLDSIGEGSALVHFTVSGTTGSGEPFTLARTNRYSSVWDISYQTIFELGGYVWEVLENRFTKVTFTDIDVRVTVDEDPRAFELSTVRVWRHGAYRTLTEDSVVQARPGQTLTVRSIFTSSTAGRRALTQKVVVPRARIGTRGAFSVSGGGGGEFFEDEEEYPTGETGPGSFEELLRALSQAPRNDQLTVALTLFRGERPITRRNRALAGDVVEGSEYWRFRVVS